MKRLFLMALIPAAVWAQPNIQKAEDFSIGTTLKFRTCESDKVNEGKGGKDQIWDFSGLKLKKDTITEWMVAPASVPNASLFPAATFVEKYSDGKYVYASKVSGQNFLLGFADETSNILIKYPNSLLFAVRPMTFGTTVTDEFTDEFSFGNMNFKGTGTCTVSADGYGTLILPNGKYSNVMRVKITQSQTDSLIQYRTVNVTNSISYVWFDENHTSALLKIDSTESGTYKSKTVEFLLSETYEEKKK